nr:phenylalanine N-monooxygenase-like [Coffea arabica]
MFSLILLLMMSLLIMVIMKKGKFLGNAKKNSKHSSPKLPPGPSPWPIVGSLLELYRNLPPFQWIDGIMKKLETDIACFRLGSVHVIVVNSPELARDFLHNHNAVFASRPITMATQHSSRGYLSMAVSPLGPQWKKMRKMYTTHLITPSRLRWLLEKRNQEADNYVSFIFNQCNKSSSSDGSVINVRTALRHYVSNVIKRIIFSKRYFGEGGKDGGPGKEEEEHVEIVFKLLKYMFAFGVSDYLPWLRVLDIQGHEKSVKKAMRILNKHHDPIIEERIRLWRDGKKKEPEDLLDVMITLKDETEKSLLSEEEIKAQCIEVFFGMDSPTTSVEWALAEMINKPELLQKAVDEIDKVVGKERLIQEYDVPQLNYVKACVKEAFRLHPVTFFNLPHVSTADAIVGGYFIPEGSHILLGRYGLGRNPKVWGNPLEFKPERHFDCDKSSKVELIDPELRMISFGSGKRACAGIALGTPLSVMALGRIVQAFTWSVPKTLEKIDLSEVPNGLELAKPLHAYAKPRLPSTMYPIMLNGF